jgi:hypothetical protein
MYAQLVLDSSWTGFRWGVGMMNQCTNWTYPTEPDDWLKVMRFVTVNKPIPMGSSGICCDMRLVQIRNQAEPSELIPRYLYEELSWLEINLFSSLYICSLWTKKNFYTSELQYNSILPFLHEVLWTKFPARLSDSIKKHQETKWH